MQSEQQYIQDSLALAARVRTLSDSELDSLIRDNLFPYVQMVARDERIERRSK